jgi:hypothetical protein
MEDSRPAPSEQVVGWGRPLVLAFAVQLLLSTGLLVIASTARWAAPPLWGQVLDVCLAATVVVTGYVIRQIAGPLPSSLVWLGYQAALYLPVVILLALWLVQTQFDFNFLPGIIWRQWLISYVFPAAWLVWRRTTPRHEDD